MRALDPFNRVMSAEHLWIASENLGAVIFRRRCSDAGLPPDGKSKHQLAIAAGFPPVGTSRQHLNNFDSHIRVTDIFRGDRALYDALRGASDAFEHGFGGFGGIQKAAHQTVDRAFACVRRAILREIGVPAGSGLLAEKFDHALGGWQPRLEVFGTYCDSEQRDWPAFYGAGASGEIADITDLDDDQRRDVKFTANASAASLLEGQELGIENARWTVPLTKDRTAEVSDRETIVSRAHAGPGR